MTQLLDYTVEGGVAVLSMAHPPTNVLTAALRAQILAGLQAALEDKMVGAIVLIGQGAAFSGGRDYSELGKPIASPTLAELCLALESAQKPVVAGLSGVVIGGGLELALACHYRVALNTTRCAMPEVALGVMPGAGGTQRGPRLLGAECTLNLFLSGALEDVKAPHMAPLTDEICDADVREASILFALNAIAKYLPPRPTADRTDGISDFQAFDAAVSLWESRIQGRGQDAAKAILECVRAAPLLPFDVGLDFERARFETLVTSEQSRALQHVALAERRASRLPEMHEAAPREVTQLGVIAGAERIGADIAVAALRHGMRVVLTAPVPAALELTQHRITAMLQRLHSNAQLTETQVHEIETRLQAESDLVALSNVEMVIEAVGQGREVSRQLMAQLDGIVKENAVIAVHDAAAQLGPVANATACPQDVVGLYVPNLHLRSAGAEIAVGKDSGPAAVATVFATLSRMGYVPVRAKTYSGLIGQSLVGACLRSAEDLLRLGVDPYEIDRVMRDWGLTMGPFQLADALGLNAPGLRAAQTEFSRVLYRMGREGRMAQKGWYAYSTEHPLGVADPEIKRIVHAVAQEEPKTVAQVGVRDGDIVKTCLAAMANCGARLIRQGVVSKPSDIDVAMIHGFGFARWRGGPMLAADHTGLMTLRSHLRQLAEHGDTYWAPEPLFDTLIKNGRGFGALNG